MPDRDPTHIKIVSLRYFLCLAANGNTAALQSRFLQCPSLLPPGTVFSPFKIPLCRQLPRGSILCFSVSPFGRGCGDAAAIQSRKTVP